MISISALRRMIFALLSASALSACATATGPAADARGPVPVAEAAPASDEPLTVAAHWARVVEADPANAPAHVEMSRALRNMGKADQAVAFMREALVRFPDNPDILGEYGKALAESGRTGDALPFLSRAAQMKPSDWRMLSAEAVVRDQTGDHAGARARFEAALKLSPNNAAILNNLGVSYLLSGDTVNAEKYLRMAATSPGATAKIRQNLALATGIRGDYAEAQVLASADLPPDVAARNLTYIRQLADAPPVALSADPESEPEALPQSDASDEVSAADAVMDDVAALSAEPEYVAAEAEPPLPAPKPEDDAAAVADTAAAPEAAPVLRTAAQN